MICYLKFLIFILCKALNSHLIYYNHNPPFGKDIFLILYLFCMEICACRLIFPPHPLYPCFTNQKSHKKTAPKKGAAFKEPFITTTHHGHYITQRKILSPPLRTTVRAARSPHALSAEQGVLSPTSNHSQGGENRCRAPQRGGSRKSSHEAQK